MKPAAVMAVVGELRSLRQTLVEEVAPARPGPIVVSGVLAEQLAKELGAGAAPGAVVVGTGQPRADAEVLVHIIAGDPIAADDELVRNANAQDLSVVLVELWPQADWTRLFVLTPFVVECEAGHGFPVREIADRIAEATQDSGLLASAVPAIADSARAGIVKQSLIRSALLGITGARSGASRPLISLEQVRMVSRLRAVESEPADAVERSEIVASAAVVLSSGFAFRSIARSARTVLPAPIAHAAVAVAGTYVLAKAHAIAAARLRKS